MQSEDENAPLVPGSGKRARVGAAKTVNILGLVTLGFFWVSGGIYGNEEMLLDAAPAHVLPLLVFLPMFYNLPMAFIHSEFSSVIPAEGGPVAWVTEVMGSTIGAHNTYWAWLCYVIDSSLYPRFAAGYLVKAVDEVSQIRGFYCMFIVVVVGLVKLTGMRTLVFVSIIMTVVSVLPSMIFIGYAIPFADTSIFTYHGEGGTNWDMLLTWVLWLYSGTFNMGSIAGEVENPQRTYLIASLLLLVLDIIFINFLPLWLSLSVDAERKNYTSGHFAVLGGELAGQWLVILMAIGAQVSQIGLYNSVSIASDRYLSHFLFEDDRPRFSIPFLSQNSYLLKRGTAGVPPLVILINSAVNLVLVWMPITATLNVGMALVSVCILLLVVAYIQLKLYRSDLKRDWELPGGVFGAAVVAAPCAILSILNIGLGFANTEGDIVPTKIVFLVAAVSVGLFVHGIYVCSRSQDKGAFAYPTVTA